MAEAAGLDVTRAVATAVDSRPLTGARDVAAVLDTRIRQRVYPLVPLAPKPWREQVPEVTDPEMQHFLEDLATAMDERKERLGEFAANSEAPWAVEALGPPPYHPVDRLEWQQKASAIGAYRELYGYDNPTDAIGSEPTADLPEKRAHWHEAFAAMRPVDGLDVRGLPDGRLHLMRRSYEAATAWAPRYMADQLRSARIAADQAGLAAVRAEAEAKLARSRGEREVAARHEQLAQSSRTAEAQLRATETLLSGTMEDRRPTARMGDHPEERAADLRRQDSPAPDADGPGRRS